MDKGNEAKKAKKSKKFKLSKKLKKKVILGVVIVVLIAIAALAINIVFKRDEKKVTIKAESYEEYAETICELATYSYTHNSVAPHYDSNGEIDYYARYNGEIQYGIKDANSISIVSEENKVVITLPNLEQLSCQATVQDTLFLGKEREGIVGEATEICTNDLVANATADTQLESGKSMIDDAKESTERMIKGLFSSFMDGTGKTLEIKWGDSNEQ